ncbi:MAG: ABC transporter permease [Candidatus Bipolaricaulota bacterium]
MNILNRLVKSYQSGMLRRILSSFSGTLGLVLIFIIILIAIFAPQLAPHNPTKIDVTNRLAGPSPSHLFGTDHLGRDLLSRLIFGSRIALLVSLPAIALGVIVGIMLGTIAGYSGGTLDNVLLFVFDTVRAFPPLLLAITIITLTGGANMLVLIIVLGVTRFPGYGRLVRAQSGQVSKREFVMASEAAGSTTTRTLLKHILPNAIGPVFINAAMDIPVIITFAAALSFLGLGVPPPIPGWGRILRSGYSYIRTSPWMVVFSAIFLVMATLGFTFLGEALRDALDPKLKKSPQLQ